MRNHMTVAFLLCVAPYIHAQQIKSQEQLIEERLKTVGFRSVALDKQEAQKHAQEVIAAIKKLDLQALQQLLEDGLRVSSFINITNKHGQTALVKTLIQMQQHLKEATPTAITAYRKAKKIRKEEPVFAFEVPALNSLVQTYAMMVSMLVHAGIDINIADDQKRTALMYAVQTNIPDLVVFLLSVPGIQLDLQDIDGNTALLDAVDNGQADMAQLLINAQASVDLANNKGDTALKIAMLNRDQEPFKKIYQALTGESRAASTTTPLSNISSPRSDVTGLLQSPSPVLISPSSSPVPSSSPSPVSSALGMRRIQRSTSASPYKPSSPTIPE